MRGRKDPRVRQVSCSLAGEWQTVEIIRAGRRDLSRHPPAGAASTSRSWWKRTAARKCGSYRRRRTRRLRDLSRSATTGKTAIDEALRQALVNLASVPAPAGEMTVVLGAGLARHPAARSGRPRPGRRFQPQEDSAFAGLLGERVAAPGVTVVDDGTIAGRRGSLTIDDEGTPTIAHRADRGRHPQRLHAGPPERAADGRGADRQRPPPVLCQHASCRA